MRHRKHRNQLGVKKEHREALLANLSTALIQRGRIKTTLKKAKALRPFVEKVITLAKKGSLHDRRIAISRVRDVDVVHELFEEKVEQFKDRNGGYTRIYKIGTRRGDAAEMALIELIDADDEGYGKKNKPKAKKAEKPAAEEAAPEAEASAEEAPAAEAEAPAAEETKKEEEAK
ncbi:50S ribosomal protein L17 [Pelagicoccus sp. NFK12]|uniref:Large ribosomal subunit protein bL17 n=1 Tax=Pelagicoccus enzymogenes TaxID=2773457 RepID=A0A927IK50_9BACT|nr:50S ribosomal protein L17 [Pelagicoccus enzymogenes]